MKFLNCVFAILEKNLGSIIIAIAIIAAASIYAYYNPYQSCKRDLNRGNDVATAYICSGTN